MGSHWTYKTVAAIEDDLEQGDILEPTADLLELFRQVHPHFSHRKYLAYMVTTQSCDLVRRRGNKCNVDYINLAVVRDLEVTLERFLDRVCRPVGSRVYLESTRHLAKQLLERILNQNEQAFGLFYLHEDQEMKIGNPSLAFLRVTVSLRSRDHYELLQHARLAHLQPEFRNKLGWLVGNLYSRIGTEDWSDRDNGAEELATIVEDLLHDEKYAWVKGSWVEAAKQAGIDLGTIPQNDFIKVLEEHKPPPEKDRIASAVAEEFKKIFPKAEERALASLKSTIPDNKSLYEKSCKSLKIALGEIADELAVTLANRIRNNSTVSQIAKRAERE